MRIFSNVEGADLTRLKAKAEELKNLSNLGLTMDLKSLTFYHETRFMRSAFDYSRSYELGKKNKNVTPDEAPVSNLFKIVESSVNNERTKFIDTGNSLLVRLPRKRVLKPLLRLAYSR